MRSTIRFVGYFVIRAASVWVLASTCATAQDLVVAQIASQTNPSSITNAKGMYIGIKAYFDAVNAAGGVNGRPLKLVVKDDNLTAPKMVELTKELIADKDVLALVGFLNSGGLGELAKQNIAGQAGIAMIAPLQGNKNIVGADNFFPFRSGYSDEIIALLKEAKSTQKKRVAIVNYSVAFGPPMAQFAVEEAKKTGLELMAQATINAAELDKAEASVKEAVAVVAKAQVDAVILVAAGRYSSDFVRLLKASSAAGAQIYCMSVILAEDLVKAVGADKARGVVIAQATPFPFSATSKFIGDYQKLMKQYAPGEALSYPSMEGYAGAKITVEALKRAGPNPTRDKILKALLAMGELDLGGVYVNYSAKGRIGWGGIDLTIISRDGKLLR